MVDTPLSSVDKKWLSNIFRVNLAEALANTVVTALPLPVEESREGNRFAISRRFDAVSDGETASILIENPEDSGVSAEIESTHFSAGGETDLNVVRDPTVDEQGTAKEFRNASGYFDDTNHECDIYLGGSYTFDRDEDAIREGVIHGNEQGNRRVGGSGSFNISEILKPGQSVLLLAERDGSDDIKMSINTSLIEREQTEEEEEQL